MTAKGSVRPGNFLNTAGSSRPSQSPRLPEVQDAASPARWRQESSENIACIRPTPAPRSFSLVGVADFGEPRPRSTFNPAPACTCFWASSLLGHILRDGLRLLWGLTLATNVPPRSCHNLPRAVENTRPALSPTLPVSDIKEGLSLSHLSKPPTRLVHHRDVDIRQTHVPTPVIPVKK
ncbi:hypothetical protein R1flu_028224 [Riccia fluitans]|uniref:Uncharacterized protein n=1 Tax=Riccia fluitans TaxID=41844 RepID=A0ABD1XL36_9MARC